MFLQYVVAVGASVYKKGRTPTPRVVMPGLPQKNTFMDYCECLCKVSNHLVDPFSSTANNKYNSLKGQCPMPRVKRCPFPLKSYLKVISNVSAIFSGSRCIRLYASEY